MTARSSAAETDAKARLRAAARNEQVLVLAAIRAADKIGAADEQEREAVRAAAHQLALARHSHAAAVVALADAVGDERAGFVLGITAKDVQTHRRNASTKHPPAAPRTASHRPNRSTHPASAQTFTTNRRAPSAAPSLFGDDVNESQPKINTTSPMAPAVSAAAAADTTR